MKRSGQLRVGVIADTHGVFDPSIVRHFRGVDHIVHAGDIGERRIIQQLQAIAPVTAVAGNVDGFERSGYPREAVIELARFRIGIRHVLYAGGTLAEEGRAFLDRERLDICVYGHTHRPRTEWSGTTMLFNPGSAGPRRFSLPRGVGVLHLREGQRPGYTNILLGRVW